MEEPYLGILCGIVGVFLFRFRNPQQDFLNTLSILTLIIFLDELVLFHFDELLGFAIWLLAGASLIIVYFLRFQRKQKRNAIDWLKVFAVGLIAVYPIGFYSWYFYQRGWFLFSSLSPVILPIVFLIFIYDRLILNPTSMKRKFVLILAAQSVAILMFIVFAFYQRTLAEYARMSAAEEGAQAQQSQQEVRELQQRLKDCQDITKN
jgi:glucose dehydrogenase